MMKYIPYTYLIGWHNPSIGLDYWYYGCEYGRYGKHNNKIANPSNLWSTYFTSSKVVQYMRIWHGEPNIIEIRKTFDDESKAREWERKVLTKLNVAKSTKWLNRTNGNFDIKCLADIAIRLHREGSSRGGKTNSKSGHLKRIAKLGGLKQGPKNSDLLRKLNESKKKMVKVNNIIYESQSAAGREFGIAAASVRDRIKSRHFPDWSYI